MGRSPSSWFVDRVVLLEYLREVVFVPDHQNILEDYLWIILRSNEMGGGAARIHFV